MEPNAEDELRERFAAALGVGAETVVEGTATLPGRYPVSELAAASVATAGAAAAGLLDVLGFGSPRVVVRREYADAWFGLAVHGTGWEPPPPWDPLAGDYRAADGWIRLHTNAAHHRAAALRVLGAPAERAAVAAAVGRWPALELQEAVVEAGGCAAQLRSPAQWAAHPQGRAVEGLPLVARTTIDVGPGSPTWHPVADRPLAGLRVLDLTRVLAGPAATRLLAGLGADVLRVDPPHWAEPALEPEMTLGKRTARLDARTPEGRATLAELLSGADVLVHGYRGGALDGLGLPPAERDRLRPGLVDVALTAYGQAGPWAQRRGFDSLVQMASGIAFAGEDAPPDPLPVQALDHATGYLVAAAVLAGLAEQRRTGRGSRALLSLARTGLALEQVAGRERGPVTDRPPLESAPIDTRWGPAAVLAPPLRIDGVPVRWERGPAPLGSGPARW